jgi:hypothetical protein
VRTWGTSYDFSPLTRRFVVDIGGTARRRSHLLLQRVHMVHFVGSAHTIWCTAHSEIYYAILFRDGHRLMWSSTPTKCIDQSRDHALGC